ncbi:MAG TPA: TetR family transcriptional regulator [Mycobacterium sp.]|uniref:TetR/AcrR family transcriptional regulator n=1 Tax=Mycolicibacterium sp. TaxID=2320850 RepID=UPI0025F2C293|nr:TetR family transcriptional regulator [Mycolicibacterium sp.]HPX37687.1 TetR family transcriptional regulator [Mycobacterium sp.]HQC76536.1 TetR family transcriptional regulator [Mycobacterium sp.]
MAVADLHAETRAYGRTRLRELALDAAREVVLDKGWSAVRMGAIASAVGISRQSLHAEFGTKDDLGHALVTRETTEFFAVVAARLAEHPGDLGGAVFAAAHYMLTAARENPLLQTILTRAAGSDGDVSLLSVLTIQGEPIIGSAVGLVGDWVRQQWPAADPDDVRVMVETIVRLAQSHILTPTVSASEIAADLALVACRVMRLPDPA